MEVILITGHTLLRLLNKQNLSFETYCLIRFVTLFIKGFTLIVNNNILVKKILIKKSLILLFVVLHHSKNIFTAHLNNILLTFISWV